MNEINDKITVAILRALKNMSLCKEILIMC